MCHLLQVGAGSGGMVVLDLLVRDPAVTRVTLIEPDVYSAKNVHRHFFPHSAVGRMKAELASDWVRERRPDLRFTAIIADLTDTTREAEFARLAEECDLGVCAVDNEPAKYAFDSLMRRAGKPWTLGEVLSGGIGGWVHRFWPGGPCYGCVASYLQRAATEGATVPPPDYANADGPVPETTIPASKASIGVIASLHAVATLELVSAKRDEQTRAGEFTSLLFTLQCVQSVFEEAFRSYRFRAPRSPACLCCSSVPTPETRGELDVAVDEALGRLAPQ